MHRRQLNGSYRLILHITDGFLLHSPENGRNFPDAALSRTTAFGPAAHASQSALPDGKPAVSLPEYVGKTGKHELRRGQM